MNNKEILLNISVGDVVKKTNVAKVMRCYDFKKWEVDELFLLENNTSKSLNEFRWEYVKETLMINNSIFNDMGILVRDLIDDVKMGYHRLSSELIYSDIANKDNITENLNSVTSMKFEYKPLIDYRTGMISHIEIYYAKGTVGAVEKKREIRELLSYLELI